jgi:hypothetical protein
MVEVNILSKKRAELKRERERVVVVVKRGRFIVVVVPCTTHAAQHMNISKATHIAKNRP